MPSFIRSAAASSREKAKTLDRATLKAPPFPFSSADQLLQIGDQEKLAIWQIMLENEKTWRDDAAHSRRP